jgi:phage shock protein PspC (stress-responsive transcriptional regulator)
MTNESTVPELHRSRRNRIVSGVAGGLGEYFDVDPLLIRLGFILLSLGAGFGLLAYILLAVIMPQESEESAQQAGDRISPERRVASRQTVALIMIGLGLLFLSSNLGWEVWSGWGNLGPILLIVVGLVIALTCNRGRSVDGSR